MWHDFNLILAASNVPEGRVFGLDMQTLTDIGIQLLNGIILVVALTWILYKPVKKFLKDRSNNIQERIDDSQATKEKAESKIHEYDEKVKSIETERAEVLKAARDQAEQEGYQIKKEAEKEAELSKQRAKEGIESDRKRLKDESRIYIIDAATLIAENYVADNISDQDQNQAFEKALTELEDSTWQN